MADTKITVCNLALGHLRQRAIVSFEERSPAAVQCRQFYDLAMETALRVVDWPFARTYISPATTPSPVPNWLYAYDYPANAVAIRYIVKPSNADEPPPYHIARLALAGGIGRRVLLANVAQAVFCYTVAVQDVEEFPPDFLALASYHLAFMLAMPLTGNLKIVGAMQKLADEAGKRAEASSTNEDTPDTGEDPLRLGPAENSTPLSVINLALGHINQPYVLSLKERSDQAIHARRFYRQALESTLRAFNWPFARVHAPGVRVTDAAISGYCYAYEYPADCLAMREIARYRSLCDPIPYKIGRVAGKTRIFTNDAAPVFVYTQRVDDVAVFDAEFVAALSFTLAALLAMPLGGKPADVIAMQKLAALTVDKAQTDAANEDTNDMGEDPAPDWLAARGVPSLTRRERGWSGYGWNTPFWNGALCLPSPDRGPPPVIIPPDMPDVTLGYVLSTEDSRPISDAAGVLLRITI